MSELPSGTSGARPLPEGQTKHSRRGSSGAREVRLSECIRLGAGPPGIVGANAVSRAQRSTLATYLHKWNSSLQFDGSTLVRRYLLLAAITFPSNLVVAQVPESQVPTRNLTEYEGHYVYRDGQTLFIVGKHQGLVAIIGEGKYALRPAAGMDTFTNGVGDRIPFLRDTAGRIMAFEEKGVRFKRLSLTVPAGTLRLLEPRPLGPDGGRIPYRYMPPAKRPDGIPTSEAGPDTLSRDVAERLVNRVIDGAYRDVRSILVYRKGALLEEYFYGYDRERPHQMRSFTKSVISLLAGIAVDRWLLSADQPTGTRATGIPGLWESRSPKGAGDTDPPTEQSVGL